ncbi:MAG TPA: S1 RNA-binding domain-containing protein, partial [Acetobacteraceae bacterium]
LVHISELQQGRVGKTGDVVNVGDKVKVKVIGFDERGKVKLSMRVVDQATGEDITEKVGAKPGRGDRDRRDRDHGDRQPDVASIEPASAGE